MKRAWAMAVWLVSGAGFAQSVTLPAEFWLAPRSGAVVRGDPTLQRVAASYLRADKARVVLHHQKRDESVAQAEELRGWLIALGIEAGRIELSDDNPSDAIQVEIMER